MTDIDRCIAEQRRILDEEDMTDLGAWLGMCDQLAEEVLLRIESRMAHAIEKQC